VGYKKALVQELHLGYLLAHSMVPKKAMSLVLVLPLDSVKQMLLR
jgi:hypothetical protein